MLYTPPYARPRPYSTSSFWYIELSNCFAARCLWYRIKLKCQSSQYSSKMDSANGGRVHTCPAGHTGPMSIIPTIRHPQTSASSFASNAYNCPVCVYTRLHWTSANASFDSSIELFCPNMHRVMTGPASEKIARKFKCPVCVVVDGLVHNKHCLRGELVISSDCLYTSNKSILRAKCMRPYTTTGHVIGAEFITTV